MNPVEALRATAPPRLVRWLGAHHSLVEDVVESRVTAYVDAIERSWSKLGTLNTAALSRPRDSREFMLNLRGMREDAAAFTPPSLLAMERFNWAGGADYKLGIDWQKAPEGSIWRWAMEVRMARRRAAEELASAERRAHLEATAPERALEARRGKIRKLRTAWHASLFEALRAEGLDTDLAVQVLEFSSPDIRKGPFEARVKGAARFVAKNRDQEWIDRVPLTRHELPR